MSEPKRPSAHALGTVFEEVAEKLLKESGYTVLERNYKYGKYEIDLIAKKKNEIAFVEVKSRKEGGFIMPEQAVGSLKINHILRAARGYIRSLRRDRIDPLRLTYSFDVVAVTYTENHELSSVKHYKDYYMGDRDELLRFAL